MSHYRVTNTDELLRAVEEINQSGEPAELQLAEGCYELTRPLILRHGKVTVRGVTGKTFLKGSREIPLPPAGADGICEISLADAGITDFGAFGLGPFPDFWKEHDIPKPHMCEFGPGLELFDRGEKLPLSRYPKEGMLTITRALGETATFYNGERNGSAEGVFQCDDETVKTWAEEPEPFLIGYWGNDWATQRHTVQSVDPVSGVISVNPPYHCYGYRDGACYLHSSGGTFYALNLKSAVTRPGEWCIDHKKGVVYLLPREGQRSVSVSVCQDLIVVEDQENIKLKGLTLCECRGNGVTVRRSQRIRMYECTACCVGGWGFLIEDSSQCKVARCRVYDVGGGGIAAGGGSREELLSSANLVEGCDITRIALWHKTYLPGIELTGVGCCARGNKIYDVPHFGIAYQGNNHVIEENEIKNACYDSNDAGGIYAGRDWTCRGTVIRYNYLHDMPGGNGNGCIGIYFDDCVSSAQVYGNLLCDFSRCAVMIGGGRDYSVHHNSFYHCGTALHLDSRGRDWGDSLYNRLAEHLQEVPYLGDTWAKAYPALSTIMTSQPRLPLGNRFFENTVIGGAGVVAGGDGTGEMLERYGNRLVDVSSEQLPEHYEGEYFRVVSQ